MLKEKKKVRLLTDSMEEIPKEPEPPLHLFTPSFTIRPEDHERLIDEHLEREEENSPRRRLEHDRRKRELMEAALQVHQSKAFQVVISYIYLEMYNLLYNGNNDRYRSTTQRRLLMTVR